MKKGVYLAVALALLGLLLVVCGGLLDGYDAQENALSAMAVTGKFL